MPIFLPIVNQWSVQNSFIPRTTGLFNLRWGEIWWSNISAGLIVVYNQPVICLYFISHALSFIILKLFLNTRRKTFLVLNNNFSTFRFFLSTKMWNEWRYFLQNVMLQILGWDFIRIFLMVSEKFIFYCDRNTEIVTMAKLLSPIDISHS